MRLKNWARSSHDGQTAETWAQVCKLCLVSCLKKWARFTPTSEKKMSNLLAWKKGLQTFLRCCCCCCSFLFRSETLRSWKLSMKANQSQKVIISRKKLFLLSAENFMFLGRSRANQKTKNKKIIRQWLPLAELSDGWFDYRPCKVPPMPKQYFSVNVTKRLMILNVAAFRFN